MKVTEDCFFASFSYFLGSMNSLVLFHIVITHFKVAADVTVSEPSSVPGVSKNRCGM